MARSVHRFAFALTIAATALAPAAAAFAQETTGTPTRVAVDETGNLVITDWVGTQDVAGNSVDLEVSGKVVRADNPIDAGPGCAPTKVDRDHAFAVKCSDWTSGFVFANFDSGSDTVEISAPKGAYIVGGASADEITVRSKGPVVVWADMDHDGPIADWDYPQGHDIVRALGSGDAELHGGSGDDEMWGGSGDDVLCGEEGGDDLHGGKGDDHLFGDLCPDAQGRAAAVPAGYDGMFDSVEGGSGHDELSGGPGDFDSVVYSGGGTAVSVSYDNVWNDGRKNGAEGDNVTDAEYVDTL